MKRLILLSAIIILTVCDNKTAPSSIQSDQIGTRCLNGVEYYLYQELEGTGHRGYGYMVVKYNPDGTISTCYGGKNAH